MEQIKRNELPETCFSTTLATGEIKVIQRGSNTIFLIAAVFRNAVREKRGAKQ